MNEIVSFKNRKIDYSKPVQVYRNVNRKNKVYSIRQRGKVVGHTTHLTLSDCSFCINLRGQQRVREEKKKNVHAWIEGRIAHDGVMGIDAFSERELPLPARVTYNPYIDDWFLVKNLTVVPLKIIRAGGVCINPKGVFAAYCE